jgi:hypothetical protein
VTGEPLPVARAALRKNLQRDVPAQPHVVCAVDVAHAAAREKVDDPVRSDHRSGRQDGAVFREGLRLDRDRRRFEERSELTGCGGQRVRFRDEVRVFGGKPCTQPFASGGIGVAPFCQPSRQQIPTVFGHASGEVS